MWKAKYSYLAGAEKGSRPTSRWHLHEPMNPALWSTLPMELLQLVFARLPLREILDLCRLSKEWNRSLSSGNSEFRRVCAEANPKLFAMISEADEPGIMSIRMYDIKTDTWHHLIDRVQGAGQRDDDSSWTMCAGDGGLVCVVSPPLDKKKRPLLITVCNPFTRDSVDLPSHDLCSVRPRMVQLVMDRTRKCYKVIVVSEKKGRGVGTEAYIFSSETRSWSTATASTDLIFGHGYDWMVYKDENDEFFDYLQEICRGPCAYESAEAQLLDLSINPWAGAVSYALVKDRLFVLQKERYMRDAYEGAYEDQRYCITEYQGQKEEPYRVKLKVHRCKIFEKPPRRVSYEMCLYACKGFLLVFANNDEMDAFRHELTWLYDFSTGVWQAMPLIPLNVKENYNDAMFELQWDAVP